MQEGHAELLRRGGDGRRRQGPHRDARRSSCRRRSGCSTSRCMPSADGVQAGREGEGQGQADRLDGKPFVGSTVVSVYDKASSTSPAARTCRRSSEFFWKWRRQPLPADRDEPRPRLGQPARSRTRSACTTSACSADRSSRNASPRAMAADGGMRGGGTARGERHDGGGRGARCRQAMADGSGGRRRCRRCTRAPSDVAEPASGGRQAGEAAARRSSRRSARTSPTPPSGSAPLDDRRRRHRRGRRSTCPRT